LHYTKFNTLNTTHSVNNTKLYTTYYWFEWE